MKTNYIFPSARITLKGDDVRLGFLVANIGKISSNEETIKGFLNKNRIRYEKYDF